jgi:phenylalanyl-tRNA synthetase beta chain
MVGVAREVSALTGKPLHLPQVTEAAIDASAKGLALEIADPQACPIYIGTVIENVQIAPSPLWLQRRLQAAGTRPINNVVDITNYVLLEWGQPLHAFDRDRLRSVAGDHATDLRIGVRLARSGETLTTLDSQNRTLQEQTLLITANDQPVALAGVMGGESTEVHSGTQALMLEAALFDSVAIRRSARSQVIRTEASTRYERGVNQVELPIACQRAIQLITELAGGTPAVQAAANSRANQAVNAIELRLDRLNQVLGPIDLGADLPSLPSHEEAAIDSTLGELQSEDVERILTALGCQLEATSDRTWRVTVPPYRYRDLEREIDLIEEVARVYGYNNFCDTLPAKTEPGYLSIEQALRGKINASFRAVGLTEVIHYSLVKSEGSNQITLSNPLFTEYSALRTELLPGLIETFQYNLEQGNGSLNAFEIGRVFWREEDGFSEADRVAGIIGGDPSQGRWVRSGRDQPLTWFEAKGVLTSVFEQLGVEVEFQPDRRDEKLHPGRTASLWVDGKRLGTFGQLHPQLRQEQGLPDQVYGFELDLDELLDQIDREENVTPPFKPYSTYPASDRDIAFFASTQVSVAEIERVVRQAGKTLLDTVELFDEYRGENVPEGKRSLAFRLTYRAGDRTLTDQDIDPVHQQVREALEEKFQVDLRS